MTAGQVLFVPTAILGYGITPVMFIWGWAQWVRRPKFRTVLSILSEVGFVLSTASAAMAVSSLVYAYASHFGEGYTDDSLLNMVRYGVLIAMVGSIFAVSGLWRKHLLRWHAPICAVGTLALWMQFLYFPIVD